MKVDKQGVDNRDIYNRSSDTRRVNVVCNKGFCKDVEEGARSLQATFTGDKYLENKWKSDWM